MVTVGILALQGDIREHHRALIAAGCVARSVRRPQDLADVDGLILPGGESTTMIRLARSFGLLDPLRDAVAAGLPMYGSCAGMILLANHIVDGAAGQTSIGGIDMVVRRNAFGRQVDSFETCLDVEGIAGGCLRAVFIRAPWVEQLGPAARPLARVDHSEQAAAAGRVVVIRQGPLLATSFHPELTGDLRIHEYFRDMIKEAQS